MKIPISKSFFKKEDMDNVLDPLKSGWVVQGPKVSEFESSWCEYTNAKYSIATTSCTSALFLSLAALDLQPDDEIIVPALSWVSTANVVENIGCKLIFCDIDLFSFNLNLKDLQSKITDKTKVIIPVHLFGYPVDINQIRTLIANDKIHIIEDAACGFGSYFNGVHVGTSGTFGCFSFHPRKAISTGEGGMITTNNEEYANRLCSLRNHGMDVIDSKDEIANKPYNMLDHSYAGYNFRMTDIQAALGNSQMKRADDILSSREVIAQRYNHAFHANELIGIPSTEDNIKHSYQSYACIFKPKLVTYALASKDYNKLSKLSQARNDFMEVLNNNGIGTRPVTHAMHTLSYFKEKYNLKSEDFPNAWAANICGFSLPIFPGLSEEDQKIVIEVVNKFLK